MKTFYRYIRPMRFDEHRFTMEPERDGGICLRFDTNPDGYLTFSFSCCSMEEHFSKPQAKLIADKQMEMVKSREEVWALASIEPSTVTEELLMDVLETSEQMPLVHTPAMLGYFSREMKHMAAELRRILSHNDQEQLKAQHFVDAAKALRLDDLYGEQA